MTVYYMQEVVEVVEVVQLLVAQLLVVQVLNQLLQVKKNC